MLQVTYTQTIAFSESSGLFLSSVCWASEKAESNHGKLPSLSEQELFTFKAHNKCNVK